MAADAARPEFGRCDEPAGANRVLISSLLESNSPRLGGVDTAHARALADSEASLPPIIVHRQTMRVIDGRHRLQAARLRGQQSIEVRFFDGSEDDAFVVAVEANVTHGLPLSTTDRESAAARILASHPQLSDRAIAVAAGLSAKTVGALRAEAPGTFPQPPGRVGRDGRVRPLDPAVGRRRAYEVLVARPTASLRDIAREAGVAIGTARDVRARVQRGEDPFPPRMRTGSDENPPESLTAAAKTVPESYQTADDLLDSSSVLRNLMKDPSLRFSDQGRMLLRWLGVHEISTNDGNDMLDAVPPHCVSMVACLADGYADEWRAFAEELRRRACGTT